MVKEYLKEIGIEVDIMNISEEKVIEMLISSHKRQREIIQIFKDKGLIDFEIIEKIYKLTWKKTFMKSGGIK